MHNQAKYKNFARLKNYMRVFIQVLFREVNFKS